MTLSSEALEALPAAGPRPERATLPALNAFAGAGIAPGKGGREHWAPLASGVAQIFLASLILTL